MRQVGMMPELRSWDVEVAADLPRKKIVDLTVSRHGRTLLGCAIDVDGMIGALSQ